jgi:hypothetical protein
MILAVLLSAGSCSRGKLPAPATVKAETPAREETALSDERVIVKAEQAGPTITASVPPGIYTEETRPSHVTLSADSPYRIVYTTTTGVLPGAQDRLASDAIRLSYNDTGDGVSQCAVLRAALYNGSEQVGQSVTFTYFSAPEGRFTTPVFSLVSEPAGLYGYEEGILVEGKARDDAKKYGNPEGWVLGNTNANYYNGGIEWERAMSMEYSGDGSGAFDFSSNGGMRVNGGWTRANTQKSLKLFSRRMYTPDSGTFTLDLFPGYRDPATGRTVSFANTILLRGGSNNEGNNVIATPVQLKLCEGTGQIVPAMRPVTEFINGQYRGVFMMIEDYDADFFEAHYGVPEEELTILSGSYENYGGSMWTLDCGEDEDLKDFIRMMNKLAVRDPKDASNYAAAEEQLDIRNFIEYMCIELYCCNSDWPDNNLRCFRRRADGFQPDAEGICDGRYRFLLKDLDLSFGHGHDVNKDPYHTIGGQSALLIRNVFNNLMHNETFRNRVYMYFCTLATAVFDPVRVNGVIGEFTLAMMPEMEITAKQLNVGGGSLAAWQTHVSGLRSFAVKRVNPVLKATEKESGKKLADLSVTLVGEGEAELGWFPASDGETRKYLLSSVIPLTVPEGSEVTVSGGTYKDGVLILTSQEASVEIAFPGQTVQAADGIVLNEVAVRNTDRPFIELYNGSDTDAALDGWSVGTKKMQSLDGYVIPAHGTFTLGEGYDVPIAFALGKQYTLELRRDGTVVDSLPLSEVHGSVYRGRLPDGGEMKTLYAAELTPGAPNAALPEFEMGSAVRDAIVICGTKTDLTVRIGETTLLPLSMFKQAFKFARDIHRTEYDWFREHDQEKMSVAELIEFFEGTDVYAEFIPEKNLFIVQ